jgi:hypothetical protein
MKKKFWLAIVIIVIVAPVFSGTKEPISYVLFFDAGIPLKVDEGFSSADFGRSFLELAGQVRLAENFYLECLYTLYPKPRPKHELYRNSSGSEIALDGLWKSTPSKKIGLFLKIGLSLASISSSNKDIDTFLNWRGGGGIEYNVSRNLLLRLGGDFTLFPISFGEYIDAYWGKFFAGIGIAI